MLLLQAVMVLHLLLRVLPIQAQGKLFVSLTYLVHGMVVVLVPNGTETNLNVIDILVVPMRLRVVLDFEMNQLVLHTGVLGVEQFGFQWKRVWVFLTVRVFSFFF